MATSYTSLLGLALPVTGELAGTWGDTVNNSITSLLDSAVAGTTTLSTDADVTLTTTTGASNQSRQAILLCSGARTVVRNITAPAQSKLYVVINSTTGGFGVVIRGVGPTTGVTVAAGKTAVVVWNGSDFVEISNSPILIGGTTTTSTLTLRSTSGVGTTGADIIFQVGNNGATEAMRVLNSGNVGIGTASPGSPLTVYAGNNQATIKVTNGPSANNVGITLESTGGNVVLNNGNGPFELSTGGSIRATLSTAGNLGLGITPSAWASGWTALQVRQGAMWSDSSARTFLSNNLYFDGTDRRYVLNGVAHEMALDSGGSYIWKQAASGIAGAAISFAQAMTLAASGNLGIGTSAPAQLLHIASGDATALIENTAATSNAQVQFKYPSRTWVVGVRGADLSGALAIRDGTATADRLIITSAGNVGIGTTTPVNALQVNGSFGRNAPVTKTTSFTLAATENWLICNGTGTITVTLPAASSWTGREVMIKNIAAFTVVSASSNVVPLSGGAAGTAILAATAGKFATLVSDGTNWIIMQGN